MPTEFIIDSLELQSANAALAQHIHTFQTNHAKKMEEDLTSTALTAEPNFKFGCDPEGFIFDGDTPVPASEAGVPGTKEEPYSVMGGAIQVDGMAAEFNIDPVDNFEDWNTNIAVVVEQLESLLPKGLKLKFVSSVKFPQEIFDKAPDESKVLGCQPDMDAYTGGVNPPPEPEDPCVRCAGGHIHIGWTENEDVTGLQHMLNCQDLVKQLDWFLGAWSTLHDTDAVRRKLYGKAGACRYKEYGVEYRVLSSFWVTSKDLRAQVWNRVQRAIQTMHNIYLPDRVPESYVDRLKLAINSSVLPEEMKKACFYPVMSLNPSYNRW